MSPVDQKLSTIKAIHLCCIRDSRERFRLVDNRLKDAVVAKRASRQSDDD